MPQISPRLRVLILGATGRLGACLVRHYRARHELLAPARADVDLGDPERCVKFLNGCAFDVLINCAGITSPDICEEQPEVARIINAAAPAAIAALCQRRGVRMIQVSTDYVFPGSGKEALLETDQAEPVNIYGETKLAGERGVLSACPGALAARVSWLFGPDKPSFPDSILRLAQSGQQVHAIADKWSTPSSIDDIAQWLEVLFTTHHGLDGALHLCNSGQASWQEYAQATVDIAHEAGLLRHPVEVHEQRLEGFPLFKARRPCFTPLSHSRFTGATGISPPTWREALERYLLGLKKT